MPVVPSTPPAQGFVPPAHKRVADGAFGRMSAAQYLELVSSGSGPKSAGRARRRRQPEEDLQRRVFEWIFAHEEQYPQLRWFFHTPNGGARSPGEAGKLKAMGVRSGVADVICPFASGPWPGFACELKAPGCANDTTSTQRLFLDQAKAQGWVCGVATSLGEFLAMLAVFLQVPDLHCPQGL